jgi:hypothetical protein
VSSAPLLDVIGCNGSRSHSVVSLKTQTASVLRPALGPFLIFDHLVSAVEQRAWSGKIVRPHRICKPAFRARGNVN